MAASSWRDEFEHFAAEDAAIRALVCDCEYPFIASVSLLEVQLPFARWL